MPVQYPAHVWAPSITFLWVASSTSQAGTTVPARIVSIFTRSLDSLLTRSANIVKLSYRVSEAGQLACILRVTGDCACAAGCHHHPLAATPTVRPSARATHQGRRPVMPSSPRR